MKKVLLAILFASVTLSACGSDTETPSTATDASVTVNVEAATLEKTYRSRNPQVCKRIRYTCAEGQEAFSDNTGCGCK
jgi:hypothetical protein